MDTNRIKLLGRHTVDADGKACFSFNLSGFTVRFRANGIRVTLSKAADLPPTYVRAELDGKALRYDTISGNTELMYDGFSGEHTFTLRRVGGGIEPITLVDVELIGEGAETFPTVDDAPLRMEFIGDSMTYGYGLLCESWNGFREDTDGDGTKTYAYLTAEALGAEIRTEAISGQGIVCKYDGALGTPIPEFFEFDDTEMTIPHDFSSWVPDIVVINAGTNDFSGGATDERFLEGVNKLLSRIRVVYPDAEVFYAYGLMGDPYAKGLAKTIAARADERMHFVHLTPISSAETGVNEHPNAAGHRRAAGYLTEAIRAALGKYR